MKDSGSSRDASSPAPIGARNDDSSLFSLENLKKTEDDARKTKNRDDSGLIDLKALASLQHQERSPQEVLVAPIVAPADLFGGSAPLAPMTAPPISTAPPPLAEAPKPSRTKLIVGMGAAVAVAAAVAVFGLSRGSSEAAPATTVAATAAAPPPTTTPTAPTPEEPKVAAVTPGERPAATQDAKPAATAPTAAPTTPKAPVGTAPRSAPKAAAPKEEAAPAKPPVDACDLACQMQRAVAGGKKK